MLPYSSVQTLESLESMEFSFCCRSESSPRPAKSVHLVIFVSMRCCARAFSRNNTPWRKRLMIESIYQDKVVEGELR